MAEQLAMFGPGSDGGETPRGREPEMVYLAVVALRDRSFTVRRQGRLHDVDGDLLDDLALFRLALYWKARRGRSKAAVERDHDREWRAFVWRARLAKWQARAPLPRGHRLTDAPSDHRREQRCQFDRTRRASIRLTGSKSATSAGNRPGRSASVARRPTAK